MSCDFFLYLDGGYHFISRGGVCRHTLGYAQAVHRVHSLIIVGGGKNDTKKRKKRSFDCPEGARQLVCYPRSGSKSGPIFLSIALGAGQGSRERWARGRKRGMAGPWAFPRQKYAGLAICSFALTRSLNKQDVHGCEGKQVILCTSAVQKSCGRVSRKVGVEEAIHIIPETRLFLFLGPACVQFSPETWRASCTNVHNTRLPGTPIFLKTSP